MKKAKKSSSFVYKLKKSYKGQEETWYQNCFYSVLYKMVYLHIHVLNDRPKFEC